MCDSDKETGLEEWKPFSEYKTPCYVLYQGERAIYDPEKSDIPRLELKGVKSMEDYDYIRVPKHLAVKLKELENEDSLYEKEVLKYVKNTKKDISDQVELLDDDVLMFKAKLASYKKAFKEAYDSADTEMYSYWETLDKKLSTRHKSLRDRFDNISRVLDREFELKQNQIERMSKKMESINTYSFEKIITFLRSFENLSPETKDIFIDVLQKQD